MLAAGGIAVLPDWARDLIGARVPVPVGRATVRTAARLRSRGQLLFGEPNWFFRLSKPVGPPSS